MSIRNHNHTEDNVLLQHFYEDGNNEWLGILLQRYTMLLFGVCMKYLKNEEEARDAVQQVFLKAIHELHKYKVEYIKSWLYMVAKNHCLMKLRDKGKYTEELSEQLSESKEAELGLAEVIAKDKVLSKMSEALKQLNKEQQQCVTLFYLEKKSYQQVAAITGFSMLQVKSHIQNGKRNLKILIGSSLENE